MSKVKQVFPVEYTDGVTEERKGTFESGGTYRTTIIVERLHMKGEVVIEIDLAAIARSMGPRACKSKGGRCVDGHVVVKRVGSPKIVSREKVN